MFLISLLLMDHDFYHYDPENQQQSKMWLPKNDIRRTKILQKTEVPVNERWQFS